MGLHLRALPSDVAVHRDQLALAILLEDPDRRLEFDAHAIPAQRAEADQRLFARDHDFLKRAEHLSAVFGGDDFDAALPGQRFRRAGQGRLDRRRDVEDAPVDGQFADDVGGVAQQTRLVACRGR